MAKCLSAISLIVLFCFVNNIQAKELEVGVSFSIAPYVIQETNSGLELELLKSALAVKGHSVNIQHLPLARTFHALKEGKLDGIINTKQNMLEGVFYSDVVISFQNCAISLKDKHFNIETVSDLQDKSIVAFQRASILLGKDFTNMAKNNRQYSEQAKQIIQVKMLMKQRMDVAVMDKNIFIYYLRQSYLTGKLTKEEVEQEVICHKVFPPTAYRFAFLHADIRDDFNFGLAQIKQDGTRLAIENKYQQMLSLTLDDNVTIRLANYPGQ
ncbi:transporter substrate-binding domain-containing protein [Shewanella aestuarii]|uniref:Transporter substrate-binding domain-containing protein n=1 Tax=Shewanella aestuarii TaxID=1028752 RepID=A0ABT0L478_9GAMM|nr:transporter substrate-binding domain-containing protein [Shewanella aestuarii]MCL1118541.1 transporter substrate-binding domain-containing protein [Shewanella aestuarii]